MPAAVAIPAIASVVGGGLTYVGQRSAAGAQQHASDAALDFAKQQEATRRQEYDRQQAAAQRAWQVYQQQLAPYRAASAGAGEYFGVHTPPQGGPDVSAMGGGQPPATLGAMAGIGPGAQAPQAPGAQPMPQMGQPMEQPGMAPRGQPLTLGNLANWQDWRNYGG